MLTMDTTESATGKQQVSTMARHLCELKSDTAFAIVAHERPCAETLRTMLGLVAQMKACGVSAMSEPRMFQQARVLREIESRRTLDLRGRLGYRDEDDWYEWHREREKFVGMIATLRAACDNYVTQLPDLQPGDYFVSAVRAVRSKTGLDKDREVVLLLGPYATHQEALDQVVRGRKLAGEHDMGHFGYAYGTLRAKSDHAFRSVFGK